MVPILLDAPPWAAADDAPADSWESQMAERVQAFLDDHKGRRGVGPLTVEIYRRALVVLERAGILDGLTPAVFHQIADELDWSRNTRASYWNAARLYSAYRLRVGLATDDPFAKTKAPGRPGPNPRPVDDLPGLLDLARDRAQRRANSKPVDEWVTLAAYAGLRCCEIARVRGEHLRRTGDGYVLDVPQGKGGTNASIPAHPEVVKVVSKQRAGFLYPGATPDTVQKAGERLFDEAGLQGGLHRLRHTYATWIYQSSGDPFLTQRLCRHRSLNSTLAYAAVANRKQYDTIGALYG